MEARQRRRAPPPRLTGAMKSRKPSVPDGTPWRQDEDRRLHLALKEFGHRWKKIAESVGDRSPAMCRNRFQRMRAAAAATMSDESPKSRWTKKSTGTWSFTPSDDGEDESTYESDSDAPLSPYCATQDSAAQYRMSILAAVAAQMYVDGFYDVELRVRSPPVIM